MRGTFGFDAAQCDYGAATAAVRQILSEWTAIDWFAPPELAAEITAMQLFVAHHRRGRAHAPDRFPADLAVRTVQGGWAEFADLCARVQAQSGWDWKFTVLKPLSVQHSKAHGWSLQEQAPDVGPRGDGKGAGPGDLFFRLGDITLWNNLGPRLDLASVLAPGFADLAGWYLSYAVMDVMECIEWQLAEKGADLGGNPFLPLLRCYAAGFCPFGLGPSEALLFGFSGR